MKNTFKSPMRKSERVIGLLYIPVHAVGLPLLAALLFGGMLGVKAGSLSEPYQEFIYYAFSFLFLLVFMFRFLKKSFSDLFDNFLGSLKSLLLGYLFYFITSLALAFLMSFFLKDLTNPNTQEILKEAKQNSDIMIAVGVLFAPVVEETMFRGALFGTIREKNRVLAYVVSVLLFSLYHLWPFMISGMNVTLLLYLLQYIPPSIALAWCYESSGNIWTPIVLHAMINMISLSVQIK